MNTCSTDVPTSAGTLVHQELNPAVCSLQPAVTRVRSGSGCSSLVPTNGASKVYRTAAEELAAFYTRQVNSEYEEHLAALKAQMREEFEYRQGELERWRERTIRRMCEGLE